MAKFNSQWGGKQVMWTHLKKLFLTLFTFTFNIHLIFLKQNIKYSKSEHGKKGRIKNKF